MLLEKEDEMECLVIGCNFLLKAVQHEAFTFEKQQAHFSRWNGEPCALLIASSRCTGP